MGERWFYVSKNKEIRKDISIFASEVFSFCATKYCLANFTYNSDSRGTTPHQQQERHCSSLIQKQQVMKQLFFGLCALAVTGLMSCDNKSEEYFGSLQNASGALISSVDLYADQDSAVFYVVASDPWTSTAQLDWATYSPTEFSKGYYSTKVKVIPTSGNSTGKIRSGQISFNLPRHKLSTMVYQSPWHNITSPSLTRDNKFDIQLMSADSTVTPLVFTTYKDGGTLKAADSWVYVDTTFAAGHHTILVPIGKNKGDARTSTITLTAGGVSTPITISQIKKQ